MMMKKCFLTAACVGMAALASSADAQSLIANWKFDETSGTVASDSAGTNDGTLIADGTSGALPIWKPGAGRFGGAVYFSSLTDDRIVVPDFNYGDDGNFTTSIWTKAEVNIDTGDNWQYFWSTGSFLAQGSFNYYITNETVGGTPHENAGSYVAAVRGDGSLSFVGTVPRVQLNATPPVPPVNQGGAWRMLTATYSTTGGTRFYVDGVLERGQANNVGISSTADMFFGVRADLDSDRRYGSSVGDENLGLIDDAAIWDFVLTDAQIMSVFQNGAASVTVPEPTTFVMLLMGTACTATLRRRRVG